MKPDIKGRSLLTLLEYSTEEIEYLLEFAIQLKAERKANQFRRSLQYKNLALIFLKPSCRTRLSFVTAAVEEGAHLEIFPSDDIRFGIKESVKDIAKVFGRMFHGIAFRGFHQRDAEILAEHAGIPVWNGLSDQFHPTQALADAMTLKEIFGDLSKVKVSYIGDGRNNVVNSLIVAAAKLGFSLSIVAPRELQPSEAYLSNLSKVCNMDVSTVVQITHTLEKGLEGSDAIYGDVWVSMGEEDLVEERIRLLTPYRITEDMFSLTGKKDSIFMHCLPALHDGTTEFEQKYPEICDVSDDVFQSSRNRSFDQAENRMHTIKAMMVATIA